MDTTTTTIITRVIDGYEYTNIKPHKVHELRMKREETPDFVDSYQALEMFPISIVNEKSKITIYTPDYSTYEIVLLDKLLYRGALYLIDEKRGVYRISEVEDFDDAYLYYSQVDEIEKHFPVYYA